MEPCPDHPDGRVVRNGLYGNAERTTRMLELVRLRLNRAEDPVTHASSIRAHLTSRGGKPST